MLKQFLRKTSPSIALLATMTASFSSAQSSTATPPQAQSSDSAASASSTGKPLAVESNEGFWGHLNPFARKKWVKRQLDPVKGRLNELDDLSAQQAGQIKGVDERAQAGIHHAQDTADQASQQAASASGAASTAQQTAQQAQLKTQQLGTTVASLDTYQPVSETEIRFRNGQSTLNVKAKDALDGIAGQLQGSKGYLVEVQGYSRSRGQSGVAVSQHLADAVVRYLVEQHQVPVYRIHVLGMGNVATKDSNEVASGNAVHVTLVQNSLAALSSSGSTGNSPIGANQQTPATAPAPSAQQ